MEELIIASNNKGKISEIKTLISGVRLLSLKDIGFDKEVEEPYDTFRENAYTKAKAVHNYCGKNVFSDDSGLCVNALKGKPGVHSAYYSGLPRDNNRNTAMLLQNMIAVKDRSAYYIAIICLIWDGEAHYFEGKCNGHIHENRAGDGGFGYDPIFIPEGYDKTFGELSPDIKNRLSHRGEAVRKMVSFIENKLR